MGTNHSKTDGGPSFNRTDQRRNSKRRMSKNESIDFIVTYLQIVKSEILQYNGFRDDVRYKEFQKVLATNAQEIQRLASSKKDQKAIDHAQREINACIRLLEQRIIDNEKRLDVAAVESHSFINENVRKSNNASTSARSAKQAAIANSFNTLDVIQRRMDDLQLDINRTLAMDCNKKMLVVLEKKIHLLYTDLEMITAEPYTPLHERKESIGRQLIKYNNKIKRAKNTSSTTSRETAQATNSRDFLRELQNELRTLEVQVNTFDDGKSSETFEKIKNNLNACWTQLQDVKSEEASLKKLKLNLIEKIKYMLNALKTTAAKNELILEIDKNKLKNIRSDIESYKLLDERDNYEDVLKLLADRVKNINDFEALQREKEQMLEELESLHNRYRTVGKSEKDERAEEIESDKAKMLYKQLCSSIEDLTNLKGDKPIVEVLEAFRDNLNQTLKQLKEEEEEERPSEPVYATPFSSNIKEGTIVSSPSANSIDNILHDVDSMTNECESPCASDVRKSQPMHSVMDVDVRVQELSKEIDHSNGRLSDARYQQINNSLNGCSLTLAEIADDNDDVVSAKREIRMQIDRLRANLDGRRTGVENEKDAMKSILNEMKSSKKRVDCFNGLYKSTLFNQIDDELEANAQKLTELARHVQHDKFKEIVDEALNKIKQYRKILDEKSIKIATDHGRNRQSITYDSYKQLEQVRNDLLAIKNEMETYGGTKRQDGFSRICSNLMRCNERLDAILDMDSKSIKASKEQYTMYIRELLKYFEEKTPTN